MFALEKQFKVLFMFFFFVWPWIWDVKNTPKTFRPHNFVKARELHPIVLHDFGQVAQTMD